MKNMRVSMSRKAWRCFLFFLLAIVLWAIGQLIQNHSAVALQNTESNDYQSMVSDIRGERKNGNLLYLLTASGDQSAESLRKILRDAEVKTPNEACKCAIDHYVSTTESEFASGESSYVTELVQLGRDVKGLGKEKDLIWVVRTFYYPIVTQFLNVEQEFWVNARTRKVHSTFPLMVSGSDAVAHPRNQ